MRSRGVDLRFAASDGGKFYHTEPCLRLSAPIDPLPGRARGVPFARTVALICNTCGSSELPMREDEWCVRMRLRPDCGGIPRGASDKRGSERRAIRRGGLDSASIYPYLSERAV